MAQIVIFEFQQGIILGQKITDEGRETFPLNEEDTEVAFLKVINDYIQATGATVKEINDTWVTNKKMRITRYYLILE